MRLLGHDSLNMEKNNNIDSHTQVGWSWAFSSRTGEGSRETSLLPSNT